MSTGKYKKYLWDSTSPVPRATLWHHRKYKTPKESTSGIANTKCLDPGLGPCDSSLLKSDDDLGLPDYGDGASSCGDGASGCDDGASGCDDGASSCDDGASSCGDGASSCDDGASSLHDSNDCASTIPDSDDDADAAGLPDSDDGLSDVEELLYDDTDDELLYDRANEDTLETEYFKPLYSGSAISLCGAICAIMQFCSANKLSYTAIGQLLKLILLLIPNPKKAFPRSVYKLMQFFEQFRQPHKHQAFCSKCENTDEECSCTDPTHADLVHISIQKPLQTILFSKFCLACVYIIVTGILTVCVCVCAVAPELVRQTRQLPDQ